MPEIEEEIDWNECLPFTGPENNLPRGTYMPSGIKTTDLIKEIKYTKSGGVISLEIDEEMYKDIQATYGKASIQLELASGGRATREEWYETMGHSDGLKLAIIRSLNLKRTGGGVHVGDGLTKYHKVGGKR